MTWERDWDHQSYSREALWILRDQTFQVPKMEESSPSYELYGYGLCRGIPMPKIAGFKVLSYLHFRYLKFLMNRFGIVLFEWWLGSLAIVGNLMIVLFDDSVGILGIAKKWVIWSFHHPCYRQKHEIRWNSNRISSLLPKASMNLWQNPPPSSENSPNHHTLTHSSTKLAGVLPIKK